MVGAEFKIHSPCFMLLYLDILKPSLISFLVCVCVHAYHLSGGFFLMVFAVFDESVLSRGLR